MTDPPTAPLPASKQNEPEKLLYWDVVRELLWDPISDRRFKKTKQAPPPTRDDI
jgi:hypothetical protein